MPEDEAPEETLDTPAPGNEAPEDTGTPSESQPAHDWEKRYGDLRTEFDSRNQRYTQYEQFVNNLTDPETQAEALRALGLEIEAEEAEDDDYADPTERFEQRFNQIESFLQQQAAAAEAAEIQELEKEYLSQSLSEIEKAESVKLSAQEKRTLESLGQSLRDSDGLPDYEAAYKLLSEAAEANRERYLKSKNSEKVGLGQAGDEKINMANDEDRTRFMANLLEAGEA